MSGRINRAAKFASVAALPVLLAAGLAGVAHGGQAAQPQTLGVLDLVGWATQNGGTSGGGSADTTTVTSASALTSALGSSSAAVIRVSGTINCSGMLRVRSNKTVIGNSG